MKLAQYILVNDLSARQFAKRIGYCESTVSRWVRGETIPQPEAMRSIAINTDFEVMPDSWFSDLYDSKYQETSHLEDAIYRPQEHWEIQQ